MAALQQKKAAQTAAPRRAFPALAVVAALLVCGCGARTGMWPWAHGTRGGAPGASPSTAAAPAAGAATDGDTGPGPGAGASAGTKRQASDQHPVDGQGSHDPAAAAVGQRRPLVVIRFDRPDVRYEPALYTAVSRALERRPSAIFDVVAVSPGTGGKAETANGADEARRHAEAVMRALSNMGLPADRLTLSALSRAGIGGNEVRIFVR